MLLSQRGLHRQRKEMRITCYENRMLPSQTWMSSQQKTTVALEELKRLLRKPAAGSSLPGNEACRCGEAAQARLAGSNGQGYRRGGGEGYTVDVSWHAAAAWIPHCCCVPRDIYSVALTATSPVAMSIATV